MFFQKNCQSNQDGTRLAYYSRNHSKVVQNLSSLDQRRMYWLTDQFCMNRVQSYCFLCLSSSYPMYHKPVMRMQLNCKWNMLERKLYTKNLASRSNLVHCSWKQRLTTNGVIHIGTWANFSLYVQDTTIKRASLVPKSPPRFIFSKEGDAH